MTRWVVAERCSDISVVVPTYNGGEYVGAALRSVFQQTLLPGEVVVADDVSSDDTQRVVAEAARSAPVPVRVLRLERNSGGPARPLNVAITAAAGRYVAVLEQDDLMLPDRLRAQRSALESVRRGDLSIGRFRVLNDSAQQEIPWYLDVAKQFEPLGIEDPSPLGEVFVVGRRAALRGLLKNNFAISNSNLFFRKPLWRKLGGFNEGFRTITDWDFMFRAARRSPVVVVNREVLHYRFRAGSLCRAREDLSAVEFGTLCRSNGPAFTVGDPYLTPELYWKSYWRLRAAVVESLRRGHLRAAARAGWMLFRTGGLIRHAWWRMAGHRGPLTGALERSCSRPPAGP